MKKQLLNERQIRKMMKIANITPLANSFISKLNENDLVEGEDDPQPGDEMVEELSLEEESLDDTGMEEMSEEEEMMEELFESFMFEQDEEDPLAGAEGGEEDLGAMGGEEGEEEVGGEEEPLASAMTALKALKLGLEELDPEAAAKIEIDTESEEGGEEEMGGEEGEEEMPALQESRRRRAQKSQKQVISEVSRRVAGRLLRLQRRKQR